MNSSQTPPEYARSRRVKPDKVLAWIASGELAAINVATKPDGRPRWIITIEAIAEFEQRRSSRPAPSCQQTKIVSGRVTYNKKPAA